MKIKSFFGLAVSVVVLSAALFSPTVVSAANDLTLKGDSPHLDIDINSNSSSNWTQVRFLVGGDIRSQIYYSKEEKDLVLYNRDGDIRFKGDNFGFGVNPSRKFHIRGNDPDLFLDKKSSSGTEDSKQYTSILFGVDNKAVSNIYYDHDKSRLNVYNKTGDICIGKCK